MSVVRLSKLLTVVSLILPFHIKSQASNSMSCKTLFTDDRSQIVRESPPQIRLFKDRGGYMGYEFLKRGPIFRDPQKMRRFINEDPTLLEDIWYPEDNTGQISLSLGRDANEKILDQQLLNEDIFNEIRKHIPEPFYGELATYVEAILENAQSRGHRFSVFDMVLRTEAHTWGFPRGHNHMHSGDLNYAKAEIGPNTEIDLQNRYFPINI